MKTLLSFLFLVCTEKGPPAPPPPPPALIFRYQVIAWYGTVTSEVQEEYVRQRRSSHHAKPPHALFVSHLDLHADSCESEQTHVLILVRNEGRSQLIRETCGNPSTKKENCHGLRNKPGRRRTAWSWRAGRHGGHYVFGRWLCPDAKWSGGAHGGFVNRLGTALVADPPRLRVRCVAGQLPSGTQVLGC